ncbi:MAG: prepilin-type N-terminal cleavage/methylation domain-containing protein [Planctomycetota bacterium]
MEKVITGKHYNLTGRRRSGFSIVELLVSISALSLGLLAAYAAQMSAVSLSNFARESDMSTYASNSALEMVTARPFVEMIDPDPVFGSVDTDELAAMQPPYDPRGFNTYNASLSKYPDAPAQNYVVSNPTLYNKVLAYGARVWEPVSSPTTKTDPVSNVSYKLYPLGTLQKPKVLVWFEPRPTLLNGVAGSYQSIISKTNSVGHPAMVPQLSDPTDMSSGVPTTVVTAVAWFPISSAHSQNISSQFNPLVLFVPPSDGSGTFTAGDATTLETARETLKKQGVRIVYNRTVIRP